MNNIREALKEAIEESNVAGWQGSDADPEKSEAVINAVHALRSADFARRVKVENRLIEAAIGRAPLPTREECRELANQLGVPTECRAALPINGEEEYISRFDVCAFGCQYAIDAGVWPEHRCVGVCRYQRYQQHERD
jgi:hypothetical protein